MALSLAGPTHAGWAQKDYAHEFESCVAGCDKSNPREHEKCVSYCGCVTDEMQVQFSDYDQFVRDTFERKRPDRVASLQKAANRCNLQIWKNPARKLRFQ